MQNLKMPLAQFKGAGFKGSELPQVKRFLCRMLKATHINQVESLLAYVNHLDGKSKALSLAARAITKHTGVSSTRKVERMSGNSLPAGDPPSEAFTAALKAAQREVFAALGFDYPHPPAAKYHVDARRVYSRTGVLWAACPTQHQAETIAAALTQQS